MIDGADTLFIMGLENEYQQVCRITLYYYLIMTICHKRNNDNIIEIKKSDKSVFG